MSEETKTVVRPNTENYTTSKSASGKKTQHNGDVVAQALDGAELDDIIKPAAEALECTQKELREKYAHLNPGMQRMNIGNRLRGVVGKLNKAEEGSGEKFIESLFSGVRAAVEKRREKAAAEKAKADAKTAA